MGHRTAVCAAIATDIALDFGCFATLDPATGLISWAYKTRPLGVGDEEIAAAEYGEADINNFAEISQRRPPAGILSIDTAGRLDTCRRYRDLRQPRFGFTDELRVVFNSCGASWGALAIYRGAGDPTFALASAHKLAASGEIAAMAIQQILFSRNADQSLSGEAGQPLADGDGPTVLIIDASISARPAMAQGHSLFSSLNLCVSVPARAELRLLMPTSPPWSGTPSDRRSRNPPGVSGPGRGASPARCPRRHPRSGHRVGDAEQRRACSPSLAGLWPGNVAQRRRLARR